MTFLQPVLSHHTIEAEDAEEQEEEEGVARLVPLSARVRNRSVGGHDVYLPAVQFPCVLILEKTKTGSEILKGILGSATGYTLAFVVRPDWLGSGTHVRTTL